MNEPLAVGIGAGLLVVGLLTLLFLVVWAVFVIDDTQPPPRPPQDRG